MAQQVGPRGRTSERGTASVRSETLSVAKMLNVDQRKFNEAQEAYDCSSLTECVATLRSADTKRATLLEARALVFLGRFSEARDRLRYRLKRSRDLEPGLLGRLHLMLGASLVRLGQFDSGRIEFRRASLIAEKIADVELTYEILVHEATSAWCERRLASATALAARAIESRESSTRIQAWNVLAMSDVCIGKRDDAVSLLVRALGECQRMKPRAFFEARILSNLSAVFLVAESTEKLAIVETGMSRLPNYADLACLNAHTFENLANGRLQAGQLAEAQRNLAQSCSVASNFGHRVGALCMLADASSRMRDRPKALEYVYEADVLAAKVAWDREPWCAQLSLLGLACRLADFFPDRATSYLHVYDSAKNVPPPTVMEYNYPRVAALERVARGTVTAALGRREEARRYFGEAMGLWQSCDLHSQNEAVVELIAALERP